MAAAQEGDVGCCIIGGCHRPGLAGGAHKCGVCGALVHNLCLQEVSGIQDKMDCLCGVKDCMNNMTAVEQQGVTQAYTARKQAVSNAQSSEDSEDGSDGGSSPRTSKYPNFPCSAGPACLDKTSTTFASLCQHQNPRHFECEQLPCVGCEEDDDGSGSEGPEDSTGSNSGRWEWDGVSLPPSLKQ